MSANDAETEIQQPSRLHVVIVTGDKAVYDGIADRIIAPALSGQITVLCHHAPLLAALEPGELIVRVGDSEEDFAIGGGFIEVRDNQVIVLADTIERAKEIDVARPGWPAVRSLVGPRPANPRPPDPGACFRRLCSGACRHHSPRQRHPIYPP